MMFFSRLFFTCTLKTLGQVCMYASQWCLLQAFVQATMWHSTEPHTLGVSYWASGLFAASLMAPGLFNLITNVAFPNCSIKPSWAYAYFVIRTMPAVMLATTCLPVLDDHAEIRTLLLSIGVLSISYYILLLAWKPDECDEISDYWGKISQQQTPADRTCSINCECGKVLRGCLAEACEDESIGSPALICMFATMSVRWCFTSLNIFYENWKAAIVLMAAVTLYAIAMLLKEAPVRLNENSSSLANSFCHDHSKTKKCGDNSSTELPVQYPMSRNYDAPGRTKRNDVGKKYLFYNTALFMFAGPAGGSIAAFALWLLTSPSLLCRWGDIQNYTTENLLILCFAIGCVAGILLRETPRAAKYIEARESKRIKEEGGNSDLSHQISSIAICCTFTSGVAIILYTKRSVFAIGACLVCFTSPLLIRICLCTVYKVVASCKRSNNRFMRTAPGIIMFSAGFCFLILHILTIMFISPQLSLIVLGKMGCIVWIESSLLMLPVIVDAFCRQQLTQKVNLPSPDQGNLLQNCSVNHGEEETGNKHILRDTRKYGNFDDRRKLRRCVKAVQIFLTLTILVTAILAKYHSQYAIITCDTEYDSTAHCDLSKQNGFDIRVMSWNILLGHKMNGRSNLDSIADFMNMHNPHIAAFQEADASPAYWGGRDIIGYLQYKFKSCSKTTRGINPLRSNLGVGILSQLRIVNEWSSFLPRNETAKIPNYSVTRIKCEIQRDCGSANGFGSGDGSQPKNMSSYLYVYSLHAVYKNWTCDRYSNLSRRQMKFVHDDITKLPSQAPVIVMGDFNINPSERELDIWFQSDLGFKSALWSNISLSKNLSRQNNPSAENVTLNTNCDCACRDSSSAPPQTTLLNRRAAVDHIFYKGLTLVKARIAEDAGNVSDHYPVVADFVW